MEVLAQPFLRERKTNYLDFMLVLGVFARMKHWQVSLRANASHMRRDAAKLDIAWKAAAARPPWRFED